jgi:hypothetical protein
MWLPQALPATVLHAHAERINYQAFESQAAMDSVCSLQSDYFSSSFILLGLIAETAKRFQTHPPVTQSL